MLTVLVVAIVAVAAVLGYAATRSNTFRIERAVNIQAPPETIFPFINNFRNWSAWSPWEKMDPALKRNYAGPPSGPGAVYEWEGNKKVGKGRMEITEAPAPSRIAIKLDFLRPFEAHNVAEFTLASGRNDGRDLGHARPESVHRQVMGVFVDMDRMVGKDFETGLANLKALAERQAQTRS